MGNLKTLFKAEQAILIILSKYDSCVSGSYAARKTGMSYWGISKGLVSLEKRRLVSRSVINKRTYGWELTKKGRRIAEALKGVVK